MKKTIKFFTIALMAAAMFTACGGDDGGDGGNDTPPDPTGYPDVVIEKAPTGSVKAGIADAIEITGDRFDASQDYILVGYDKDGKMETEKVSAQVLTVKTKRISFGIHVDAEYIGKPIVVYLDRPGYSLMPLTTELTLTLPTIEEGYIPDPLFRKTLAERNPNVAELITPLGMIDVAGAAILSSGGSPDGYALDLYQCPAKSYKGIELFMNLKGPIAAWDAPNVEEIDFSNWKALGVTFHSERALSLKKFIGSPYMLTAILQDCPKLTYVDISMSDWCHRCDIRFTTKEGGSIKSAVTYLDMRRLMTGTGKYNPNRPSNVGEYTIFDGDSYFLLADNATVKLDSWTLFDHNIANNGAPSCWANIHDSWTCGAKIEVYSWRDIAKYLDTAPLYSVDPDALSPANKNGNQSSNKWVCDDPAPVL